MREITHTQISHVSIMLISRTASSAKQWAQKSKESGKLLTRGQGIKAAVEGDVVVHWSMKGTRVRIWWAMVKEWTRVLPRSSKVLCGKQRWRIQIEVISTSSFRWLKSAIVNNELMGVISFGSVEEQVMNGCNDYNEPKRHKINLLSIGDDLDGF